MTCFSYICDEHSRAVGCAVDEEHAAERAFAEKLGPFGYAMHTHRYDLSNKTSDEIDKFFINLAARAMANYPPQARTFTFDVSIFNMLKIMFGDGKERFEHKGWTLNVGDYYVWIGVDRRWYGAAGGYKHSAWLQDTRELKQGPGKLVYHRFIPFQDDTPDSISINGKSL